MTTCCWPRSVEGSDPSHPASTSPSGSGTPSKVASTSPTLTTLTATTTTASWKPPSLLDPPVRKPDPSTALCTLCWKFLQLRLCWSRRLLQGQLTLPLPLPPLDTTPFRPPRGPPGSHTSMRRCAMNSPRNHTWKVKSSPTILSGIHPPYLLCALMWQLSVLNLFVVLTRQKMSFQ